MSIYIHLSLVVLGLKWEMRVYSRLKGEQELILQVNRWYNGASGNCKDQHVEHHADSQMNNNPLDWIGTCVLTPCRLGKKNFVQY